MCVEDRGHREGFGLRFARQSPVFHDGVEEGEHAAKALPLGEAILDLLGACLAVGGLRSLRLLYW